MLEFIGVHASGPQQAAAFGCQVRGGGRQAAVFIDQDHGKLIRAELVGQVSQVLLVEQVGLR